MKEDTNSFNEEFARAAELFALSTALQAGRLRDRDPM
jgi:hypothetical protein